jgi:hypothetical protein
MDKKTTGIIATVIAALLCGCPGLVSLCWGVIAALVSFIPGANIDIGGSSDPKRALATGIGALCLGIVFIAIPIVVGVVMLRKKPVPETPSNEPLPPAI